MKELLRMVVVLLSAAPAAAQAPLIELRPADMGAYADFGASVAAQGELAAIGAPGENALAPASGAVHVLRFLLGTVTPEALLVPDDGSAGDRFGTSVALDGDLVLVGAPAHAGGAGAAYVFRCEAQAWTQEALLVADGTNGFGRSVTLHGDTALVLDPQGGVGTLTTVHVFRRVGTAWQPEAVLTTSATIPAFGTSLALNDDTAFVAQFGPFLTPVVHVYVRDDQGTATVDDDLWTQLVDLPVGSGLFLAMPMAASGDRLALGLPGNFTSLSGTVVVYERDDGGTPGVPLDDAWSLTAQLVDSTGSASFGFGLGLDGDLLLGTAPSASPASLSLFRFDGVAWQLEDEVQDTFGDALGAAAAVSGTRAFVADGSDALGPDTGRVRVAEELGGAWSFKKQLLPDGLIRVGCFGCAVDVAGGPAATVLVGAQLAEPAGAGSGAAYAFRRDADVWRQEARLLPSGLAPGDRFGSAVAVDGDRALVGAHLRDGAFVDQGAAFVFRRQGGVWTQEAEIVAPAPSASACFGFAVALAGDVALVGSYADDLGGADAGAVFAFRFDGSTWSFDDVLRAQDAAPGAHFGYALALEPGRALVGAPGVDGARGAAYVFGDTPGGWVQEEQLAAFDAAPFDFFGLACALSGDSALVGAPRVDGAAVDMGAAYAFVRDPASGAWSLEQKLQTTTSGAWSSDWYGASVALQGDAALVGAPDGGHGYLGTEDGKVSRLVRTPQTADPWIETAVLQQEINPLQLQKAGFAVALDLDTAAIGAPKSLADLAGWDFAGSAFVGAVAPPLTAEPASLSAAGGGTQTLRLDAPIAEAGLTFLVLGSLSGTAPGLAFGAWVLPLNPDPYFHSVLNEPDQAPASGFLGVLDAQGDATASVVLAPGLAIGLEGTTAQHAFLVLDLGAGVVTFVSNPAPLAIAP